MPNAVEQQGAAAAADGGAEAPKTSPAKSPNPAAKRYHTILRDFMAYTNQAVYSESHTFSDEELLKITPDHLIRYFSFKLYGDEYTTNPDPNTTEKPRNGSHHTLGKYKYRKVIFAFNFS